MKQVYCAHCGARLPILRKAMPKYGHIIDVVPRHDCPEVPPEEFDLRDIEISPFEGKMPKFVEKLNELDPKGQITGEGAPPFQGLDDPGLRDRRPAEHVKDTPSPSDLIERIKSTLISKE